MDRKNGEHLRINRQHPRIGTKIPCKVGLPGCDLSTGLILNLSGGGLKFSCARDTFHSILPEDLRTLGPVMDVEIEVQFHLRDEAQSETLIKTSARIVHSERLAQDLFHVGVQFLVLDKAASRALETYVGELRS